MLPRVARGVLAPGPPSSPILLQFVPTSSCSALPSLTIGGGPPAAVPAACHIRLEAPPARRPCRSRHRSGVRAVRQDGPGRARGRRQMPPGLPSRAARPSPWSPCRHPSRFGPRLLPHGTRRSSPVASRGRAVATGSSFRVIIPFVCRATRAPARTTLKPTRVGPIWRNCIPCFGLERSPRHLPIQGGCRGSHLAAEVSDSL